jgi:predicted  nucleic acid-binding Zn-ribbon protein
MDASKSSIPYREQPALVDESLPSHNYPGMEDRMARMEVNIAYIRRDVDELGVGFRRMSEDISSLKDTIQAESSRRRDQFTELRGEIGDLRTELRGEIGELRAELRGEIGDVRLAITTMDSRLERKLEQHLLKLQSRMLWTIGATIGPIVLAWFIQTFLPVLRISSGG